MDRRIATLQFLEVCSPSVAEVFHYWDRKRAGRALPPRSDIDPDELRRHLPAIMLVEVKRDPLDFVYRLVGTREAAARGSDPTGKRVAESWFGPSAPDVIADYERVVAGRSFLYGFDKFVRPDGRQVQGESLFLPLATGGEDVGQIMVYSFYRSGWAGSRPTARKLLPVLDE